MGRQGRVGDQLRERLKSERERHGWSQADVAKMLADKGIGVYPTTIAKIEAGDRAIRVDELNAIADLFEVSVDALLGRRTGAENDLVYNLRGVLAAARDGSAQVASIRESLLDRFRDLDTLDFDGLEAVVADAAAALAALNGAAGALSRVAEFRLDSAHVIKLRMGNFVDGLLTHALSEMSVFNPLGYLNEVWGKGTDEAQP
ncbi:hypothetical protein BH09ACT7_BH09ACT7_32510 [soil metagenome]